MSVELAGVRWGRLGSDEVGRRLAEAAAAELTYDHVGSTLAPDADAGAAGGRHEGRRPYVRRRRLGEGEAVFATGVERLRAWASHRHLGALVHPPDAPLAVGTEVLVELRLGPLSIVVPNRVVVVVDEPRRFGFAYGTLPGHAERGEESFLVEWGDDDVVIGVVAVDAVPATLGARLASPGVRLVQRRAVDRYLEALDPDLPA